MRPFLIHLIAATRPNFMKIAPLYHALKKKPQIAIEIVHTGQHYDANMSDIFFKDLQLPSPDHNLNVGSGSHGFQTGETLIKYEQLLLKHRPQLVVVVGDVNATLACALAASKLHIPIAHLEAGLRSRDAAMPEEINRILTDRISDYLWTPSINANTNLENEGIPASQINLVGNIMIDSLVSMMPSIKKQKPHPATKSLLKYGLVTIHRPRNVDKQTTLTTIVEKLGKISTTLPLILPLHPRTRKNLETFHLFHDLNALPNVYIIEPQGYLSFSSLVLHADLVITDSGGIQEETTYLNIPCVTLRPNTERPITLTHGTNCLASPETLVDTAMQQLDTPKQHRAIPNWDGKTSERIANIIATLAQSADT